MYKNVFFKGTGRVATDIYENNEEFRFTSIMGKAQRNFLFIGLRVFKSVKIELQ